MSTCWGTVESTEDLTPAMVRVRLGGDGLGSFEPTGFTDQYINAQFLPDASAKSVPFDLDEARQGPAELRPRGRRLTVRAWDLSARALTLDVVTHGDVGHAGRWARRATIGDRLQFLGPSGGYRPDPAADWHLLLGDESAVPAISASLEAMPSGRPCVVRIVVDSAEHELDLASQAEVDLRWLHRGSAERPFDLLVDEVAGLEWSPGRVDVFAHGEAGEIRAVRRHLLAERGIRKEDASISPYWRRDHTDEAWRAVKADWLAEQDRDV